MLKLLVRITISEGFLEVHTSLALALSVTSSVCLLSVCHTFPDLTLPSIFSSSFKFFQVLSSLLMSFQVLSSASKSSQESIRNVFQYNFLNLSRIYQEYFAIQFCPIFFESVTNLSGMFCNMILPVLNLSGMCCNTILPKFFDSVKNLSDVLQCNFS